MEEVLRRFNHKDDMGNELKIDSGGILYLKLVNNDYKKKRNIGSVIYIEDDMLVYQKFVIYIILVIK